MTLGEENVVNEIHQHILSKRKGYGSRAEKSEYQVPLEGRTSEKHGLKCRHQLGEKIGRPIQRENSRRKY